MKVPIQSYINCHPDKLDQERKRKVVTGIINDILKVCDRDTSQFRVLDVGAGLGDYSLEIAKYVKEVVGVEPDKRLYEIALDKCTKSGLSNKLSFHNCAIEDYGGNRPFDLILSLTTFEHMPNHKASFDKIFSLMHHGSILYFTAPNRLWPFESHYRLYLLSWLPLPLANLYVKISGRGESYADSAYSKTYWGTKKFFKQYRCTLEFVTPDADAFHIGWGNGSSLYNAFKSWGIALINKYPAFWSISKGFIIVIRKI